MLYYTLSSGTPILTAYNGQVAGTVFPSWVIISSSIMVMDYTPFIFMLPQFCIPLESPIKKAANLS